MRDLVCVNPFSTPYSFFCFHKIVYCFVTSLLFKESKSTPKYWIDQYCRGDTSGAWKKSRKEEPISEFISGTKAQSIFVWWCLKFTPFIQELLNRREVWKRIWNINFCPLINSLEKYSDSFSGCNETLRIMGWKWCQRIWVIAPINHQLLKGVFFKQISTCT